MTGALPKYTRWDQVPAELYTKTQLANLTPSRKLRKDAQPVARVLYMGNKYAPLYQLDDSVEKPPATEAQKAAAAKAKAAQWICKRCDHHADPDGPSLGRGRLCDLCHGADADYREHLAIRRDVQRVVERFGERGVLIHATGMGQRNGLPQRVVAVALADETVLADIQVRIGPPGYRAALDQLHQVLTEHGAWTWSELPGYENKVDYRFLLAWSFDTSARACLRLLNPLESGRDLWQGREMYPWLSTWFGIQSYWAGYHRARDHALDSGSSISAIDYGLALPDATGDAVEDARLAIRLLQAIAAGEAPTASSAFFRHPLHGNAEVSR